MVDFPDDEQIRLSRIARQNTDSDMAFLLLENSDMSPEEEADTWRSLYNFHLKKLKEEI